MSKQKDTKIKINKLNCEIAKQKGAKMELSHSFISLPLSISFLIHEK